MSDYEANNWKAPTSSVRKDILLASVASGFIFSLYSPSAEANMKESLLSMLNKALKPVFDMAFGSLADQVLNIMDSSHQEQMAANGKAFDAVNEAQVTGINHELALNAMPGAGYCEDEEIRDDSEKSVHEQLKTTLNLTKSNSGREQSAEQSSAGSKSQRAANIVYDDLSEFFSDPDGRLNFEKMPNRKSLHYGFADGETAKRDLTTEKSVKRGAGFTDILFSSSDVKNTTTSPFMDKPSEFSNKSILLNYNYVENISSTARITMYKQPFYYDIGEHSSNTDGKSTSSLMHEKIRSTYLSVEWNKEVTGAGAPTPNMSVILRESAFNNLMSLKRYEAQSTRAMLLAALVAENTVTRGHEIAGYGVILNRLGRRN